MYGIHTSPRIIDGHLPRIFKPLALAAILGLTACAGGDIMFEGGSQVNTTLDENSSSVVWTAKVQVKGALDSKNVVFSLSGEDAALFTLDPTTGALSFKTSPDFEAPLDADKNNDYRLVITAAVKDKTAQQQLSLKVNNLTKPVVELIKPKLFENVGRGESVDIDAQVRFYDAESNTPIKDGRVSLNSLPLVQAEGDAMSWRGRLTVPGGGIEVNLEGQRGKTTLADFKTKLFNKTNPLKALRFGAFEGDEFMVLGPNAGLVTKYDLKNNSVQDFDGVYLFNNDGVKFRFHPRLSSLYYINYVSAGYIFSGNYDLKRPSLSLYGNGAVEATDIAVDDYQNRIVLLSKDHLNEEGNFSISSLGLNQGRVFSSEDYRLDSYLRPIWIWDGGYLQSEPLFKLPTSIIKGVHKYFDFDGATRTYIFADERIVDGKVRTIIQGYGADGSKRFESKVGPDISNLVVHEPAGVIYVADNSHSAHAKLKSIDILSGNVSELLDENVDVAHGAYSGLGLDRVKRRLYVGDVVSDAIYWVDLESRSVQELGYRFIPSVPIADEPVEN